MYLLPEQSVTEEHSNILAPLHKISFYECYVTSSSPSKLGVISLLHLSHISLRACAAYVDTCGIFSPSMRNCNTLPNTFHHHEQ